MCSNTMRRLLAIISAALTMAFAGLSWTTPKEDFYSAVETYYQCSQHAKGEDYANLYARKYATTGSTEPCDITPTTMIRKVWESMADFGDDEHSLKQAWIPVHPVDPDADAIQVTKPENSVYIFYYKHETDGEFYISAPTAGMIQTSHFNCDWGHMMNFQFVTGGYIYNMEIKDAKCWYCCRDKKEPESGNYKATTSDDLRGKNISEACLLCVGKQGTTVAIQCIGPVEKG